MSAGSSRPSVVIVGGGYAGVAAALALDERLDVTVVDPKDAFMHCVAALRALVDEAWMPHLFLPYGGLLTHGRVVRDRAVGVSPGEVRLASGTTLRADFVVLATGSSYPFPAKADVEQAEEAAGRYGATREALRRAADVLIVGGGPVGIELAGEIVSAMPDKHVTILDMADDVLGPRFGPELKAELRRQLAERGVDVVLGSPLRALPPTEPGELGRFTVATERGDELSADIWFRCWGVVPASDFLAASGIVRDAAGFVPVDEHLRVVGHERLFAIGDLTAGDAKMAAAANRQAAVAAANILAVIDGAELKAHRPMGPAIAVPIGPDGGAGQFPGQEGVVGPEVVSRVKGADLGVTVNGERFRVAAATRPDPASTSS